MTNLVTAIPTTNIEDLPDFVLAHILRITEQSTCAQVSKQWRNIQRENFRSLWNEYRHNPKIQRFMPTMDCPETGTDYSKILCQTVANVRNYYRKFSNVQPDRFLRTNLIETRDLEELISEADDKNLVTLWNHLPPEIIQQLADLTPYPANATNTEKASAIRNGISSYRESILDVLSHVTKLSLISKNLSALPPEIELFVNLQELDLRNNQLTTMPPEIGHLVNLRWIDLDRNPIDLVHFFSQPLN